MAAAAHPRLVEVIRLTYNRVAAALSRRAPLPLAADTLDTKTAGGLFRMKAAVSFVLVVMLYSGVCSQSATSAAGAKDAEKNAAAYAGKLRTLATLLVLTSAGLVGLVVGEVLEVPPKPLLIASGAVAAFDLIGCLLGISGTSKLLGAFEAQKNKSKAK